MKSENFEDISTVPVNKEVAYLRGREDTFSEIACGEKRLKCLTRMKQQTWTMSASGNLSHAPVIDLQGRDKVTC